MDNVKNKVVTSATSSSNDDALAILFGDIFKSYESALYKLALGLTKDDVLAKDIIQDVFLKLWEIRTQLGEIENIEAFLFSLTRNKVMDFFRKVTADERLKKSVWNDMQEIVGYSVNSMEIKEYHRVIAAAIEQLPSKRKEVYLLRIENDLSYQQIADHLQISRHTVKHQISFALQSIRTFVLSSFKTLL
jgi:RNA polymerase sigma-70 factor (family 1)